MPQRLLRLIFAATLCVAALACAQHATPGPSPLPSPAAPTPSPGECETGIDFDHDGVALACDELLELPAEMRPPGEPVYEYHLAAAGDTATAFIAGPCLGKVPGNCPAGAPLSVQGDRHASLRRAMMEREARLSARVSEDGTTWYRQLAIASPERLVRLVGEDEQALYEGQLNGRALYPSPTGGMFVRYQRDGAFALDHWLAESRQELLSGAAAIDLYEVEGGFDVEVQGPDSELRDVYLVRGDFPAEPDYAGFARGQRFGNGGVGTTYTCLLGGAEGTLLLVDERSSGGEESSFVLPGASGCPGVFRPAFGEDESLLVAPMVGGHHLFRWRRGDASANSLGDVSSARPTLGILGDDVYFVEEGALWRHERAGEAAHIAELPGAFHRLMSDGTHLAVVYGADINASASVLLTDGETLNQGTLPEAAAGRAEGQWLAPDGRLFVVTRKDEGTLVSYADGEFAVHEGTFSYYGTTLNFYGGVGLLGTEHLDTGAMYRVNGATLTRLRDVGGRYATLPGSAAADGEVWVVYPGARGSEVAVFDGESFDVRLEDAEFGFTLGGRLEAPMPVDSTGRPWLVYRSEGLWSAAFVDDGELRVEHRDIARMTVLRPGARLDGSAAGEPWGMALTSGDENERVRLCPFATPRACASLHLAGATLNGVAPITITDDGHAFAFVRDDEADRDYLWRPRLP